MLPGEQQLPNIIRMSVCLPSAKLTLHMHRLGWLGLLVSATIYPESLVQSGALCELTKARVSTAIPVEAEEGSKSTRHCQGSIKHHVNFKKFERGVEFVTIFP